MFITHVSKWYWCWCWCWWFITCSHPTLLLTAHWRIVQFPENNNRIATVRCKIKMIVRNVWWKWNLHVISKLNPIFIVQKRCALPWEPPSTEHRRATKETLPRNAWWVVKAAGMCRCTQTADSRVKTLLERGCPPVWFLTVLVCTFSFIDKICLSKRKVDLTDLNSLLYD